MLRFGGEDSTLSTILVVAEFCFGRPIDFPKYHETPTWDHVQGSRGCGRMAGLSIYKTRGGDRVSGIFLPARESPLTICDCDNFSANPSTSGHIHLFFSCCSRGCSGRGAGDGCGTGKGDGSTSNISEADSGTVDKPCAHDVYGGDGAEG